ncbi:carbohydrate-binding WSC, partial [Mycena epipterygia]
WVSSNACAVDTSARLLQGYSVSTSSNTPSTCQSTCANKGFSIAGVENGNECYCANTISGGAPSTASTTDCNVPCTGDSSSKCGGGWRIQIYTASSWVLSNACAIDTSARILQGYSVSTSLNTPSTCQSTCAGKGFSIAGVENGNECYCANTISGGTPSTASTTDCSVPCAGDSSSKCGGGWRIQIY